MPRTRAQLDQAAADAEAWLNSLDPDVTPAEDIADLGRVGAALNAIAAAERELADAVAAARGNGRSWGEIALVLGVSKQSARERFGSVSPTAP